MIPAPTKVFHIKPMTPAPLAKRALEAIEEGLKEALSIVSLIALVSGISAITLMVHH